MKDITIKIHLINSVLLFLVFVVPSVIICCESHAAVHKFSILEEQAPTTLGKINFSSFNNNTHRNNITAKQIIFLKQQNRFLIDIDTKTGAISSLAPIDREEIEFIRIWIVDLPPREDVIISEIVIEIIDINDNQPRFVSSVLHASIPENARIGDAIELPLPMDPDSSRNGVIKKITILDNGESTVPRFSVYFKSEHQHWYLLLSPGGTELDRELEPFILLNVSCTDSGSPFLESQTTIINITVVDTNDNSPTFNTGQNSHLVVPASTKINTLLVALNATDLDTGENSMITFNSTGNGTQYFAVNSQGFLYLAESLVDTVTDSPICRPAYFGLKVTVSDLGTPSCSASTDLVIQVYSGNNPPNIELKDRNITLSESAVSGSEITSGNGYSLQSLLYSRKILLTK